MEYPALAWARYEHGNKKDYRLLFLIGETAAKYIALDASSMPEGDVEVIRQNIVELRKFNVDRRVVWVREHVAGWKHFYKEIYKERLTVQEVFKVTATETKD